MIELQKSGDFVRLNDSRGIEVLGDLIEPSFDSKHPEYYGALHNYGHIMLGQITDPKGKFNVCHFRYEKKMIQISNRIINY